MYEKNIKKENIRCFLCIFASQRNENMETCGHLYYPKNLSEAPAYIFNGLAQGHDLCFLPDFTLQPRPFWRKMLKFLLVGRIPLSGRLTEWITGYKGYQRLTTLQPNDRLLVNGVTNLRTLRAVKWLTPPHVRRFQYFNNCLRFVLPPARVGKVVAQMQQMGYRLVTFDPQEAKEYGMTYAPQFYRFPDVKPVKIRYDFFFCGEKKNRGDRLEELRKSLEDKGFRCLFIIVDGSSDTRISYEQYLEHVMESRCIVDFFQHGQVGLTRRPMESLFFNKKLLTENPHILEFDFYHPENIFVFGRDDFSQIRKFLESKPVLVPDDIKRQYDVSQWLRHFD